MILLYWKKRYTEEFKKLLEELRQQYETAVFTDIREKKK